MLYVLESLGVLKAEEGVKGLRAASVTFELSRRLGKGRDGWMDGRADARNAGKTGSDRATNCLCKPHFFAFFYCFCCSCVIQT